MNLDNCSFLHKTALGRESVTAAWSSLKPLKGYTLMLLEALAYSPDKYSRAGYNAFLTSPGSKPQDSHRGTGLHGIGGHLRPQSPPLSRLREGTGKPKLLALSLAYITPDSSSPWKLRPIPWKIILFSLVCSRREPA